MGMFLKNFRVLVVEKRKKDDQNKLVQDLSSKRFSIPGGAYHTPPPPPQPPGISVIFQLDWVPFENNICLKNVVALYHYAKDIFFCDKMRTNLFIHVNTVSNNLKDVLR